MPNPDNRNTHHCCGRPLTSSKAHHTPLTCTNTKPKQPAPTTPKPPFRSPRAAGSHPGTAAATTENPQPPAHYALPCCQPSTLRGTHTQGAHTPLQAASPHRTAAYATAQAGAQPATASRKRIRATKRGEPLSRRSPSRTCPGWPPCPQRRGRTCRAERRSWPWRA